MTPSPGTYGPVQLGRHLGLQKWQFSRARAAGLIEAPDAPKGRWSAACAAELHARREEILAAVGEVPDVGAVRAAAILTDRLGVDVPPDAVPELARVGLIARAGFYDEHAVYCGRSLEALNDRAALLDALKTTPQGDDRG